MTNTRPTNAEIVKSPATYGLTFDIGKLNYRDGKNGPLVALPAQPFLRVTDTALFESFFAGVQLKHQNGSSIKVHGQAIGRNMAKADRKVKPEAVKLALVDGICFGATTSASTSITIQRMTDDEAAGVVALLVAAGMSATDALAKVAELRAV